MTPRPTEALQLALEAEKTSLQRYLEYAWLTRDADGRGMFIRLALDEFEHMSLLERQLTSLAESGCWRAETPPRSLIEKLIPSLAGRSGEVEGTKGTTRLTALRSALDLETRARDFYRDRAVDAAAPPPVREMFTRLAEMEQAHADLIQAELDSVSGTGFWLSFPEFTLEAPDR